MGPDPDPDGGAALDPFRVRGDVVGAERPASGPRQDRGAAVGACRRAAGVTGGPAPRHLAFAAGLRPLASLATHRLALIAAVTPEPEDILADIGEADEAHARESRKG